MTFTGMAARTPKEELDGRTVALQRHLAAGKLDGALVVQNADLLYFAGTVQPSCLFIPPEGEPILFVRKNHGRAREESVLKHVVPIDGLRDLPGRLADFGVGRIGRLGMELDILPVNQHARFVRLFPSGEIVDLSPAIQIVRAIKSEYETGLIAAAAVLVDFMLAVARDRLAEGMTELELAGQVEAAARARGHQGFLRVRGFNQEVYWGYLVAGPGSAASAFVDTTTGGRGVGVAFPAGAGHHPIARHEPVLFDLVGIVEGYNSDMTRTLCLGPLPGRLDRAHRVALEILQTLAEMIRPGIPAGDLFLRAERMAAAAGLGEHFMGCGRDRALFCGHGIGIELDELPVIARGSRTPLAPGMVMTVEPKFTFPGVGSVGVEDNYAVTGQGARRLTLSTYDVEV